MTLDFFLKFIDLGVGGLIKISLLAILFLYVAFAAVIVRQIQLMNKVINQANFSSALMFISLIHFLVAVALFFLTLIIL